MHEYKVKKANGNEYVDIVSNSHKGAAISYALEFDAMNERLFVYDGKKGMGYIVTERKEMSRIDLEARAYCAVVGDLHV